MAEKAQGITAITVGGYKSIRDETTIEIRPLTILAGANSSGKSSIMQPMLMMKQTLEATQDPGPLLLDGPHVQFTRYEQFLPKTRVKGREILTVGIEHAGNSEVLCEFSFVVEENEEQRQIVLSKMTAKSPLANYMLTSAMSEEEIIESAPEYFLKIVDVLAKSASERNLSLGWEVRSSRCFLRPALFFREFGSRFPVLPLDPIPEIGTSVASIVHLPGLRGNPARAYHINNVEAPEFPGPFQHYTASLISRWKDENNELIKWVEKSLYRLDLTGWVEVIRVDDISVELKVGRLPNVPGPVSNGDCVSIADVGIGVSQVLPVLVALIAAEPGQMVYIEQPEMHLHPKAQVALASVLADAAKRGVRVVVETHSSLLLQGVMTLISEGVLSNEIVKLHWFERNQEGNTIVTSKDFHENGTHDGDWPVDFADIRLEEQRRYLDAVTKRRTGLVNEPS